MKKPTSQLLDFWSNFWGSVQNCLAATLYFGKVKEIPLLF